MTADELAWGDLDFELLAELQASLLFRLAATVGYENIWSRNISSSTFGAFIRKKLTL